MIFANIPKIFATFKYIWVCMCPSVYACVFFIITAVKKCIEIDRLFFKTRILTCIFIVLKVKIKYKTMCK